MSFKRNSKRSLCVKKKYPIPLLCLYCSPKQV
uniref:Uncharacterized protein n=1 Tax=Rhizophora mucronata TaxID=61149 RepID=A0A2P2NVE6_RHIMU